MPKKFQTILIYPDGKKFTTYDNCIKIEGYKDDCILFNTLEDDGKIQHHAVLVGGGMVHIIRENDVPQDTDKLLNFDE